MCEITELIKKHHEELKKDWIKEGCPSSFYEWLLERIEQRTTLVK